MVTANNELASVYTPLFRNEAGTEVFVRLVHPKGLAHSIPQPHPIHRIIKKMAYETYCLRIKCRKRIKIQTNTTFSCKNKLVCYLSRAIYFTFENRTMLNI